MVEFALRLNTGMVTQSFVGLQQFLACCVTRLFTVNQYERWSILTNQYVFDLWYFNYATSRSHPPQTNHMVKVTVIALILGSCHLFPSFYETKDFFSDNLESL